VQVHGAQFLAVLLHQEVELVAQRTRRPSIASVYCLIVQNIGPFNSQITCQFVDLQRELLGDSEPATEVAKLAGLQSEGSEMIAYGARLERVCLTHHPQHLIHGRRQAANRKSPACAVTLLKQSCGDCPLWLTMAAELCLLILGLEIIEELLSEFLVTE
jgi:hypothetical protein